MFLNVVCPLFLTHEWFLPDNGAYLYYHFDGQNSSGYARELLAVLDTGKQKGIPFRYLQFDSW